MLKNTTAPKSFVSTTTHSSCCSLELEISTISKMLNAKLIAGYFLAKTRMGALSDMPSIDCWCKVSGDAKVYGRWTYRFMRSVLRGGTFTMDGQPGNLRMANLMLAPGAIPVRSTKLVVLFSGRIRMGQHRCWMRMARRCGTQRPFGNPTRNKLILLLGKISMGPSSVKKATGYQMMHQ